MKKISICTLIVSICINSHIIAQIYTPDGLIQGNSNNENVGIGIDNPNYNLDVNGSINANKIFIGNSNVIDFSGETTVPTTITGTESIVSTHFSSGLPILSGSTKTGIIYENELVLYYNRCEISFTPTHDNIIELLIEVMDPFVLGTLTIITDKETIVREDISNVFGIPLNSPQTIQLIFETNTGERYVGSDYYCSNTGFTDFMDPYDKLVHNANPHSPSLVCKLFYKYEEVEDVVVPENINFYDALTINGSNKHIGFGTSPHWDYKYNFGGSINGGALNVASLNVEGNINIVGSLSNNGSIVGLWDISEGAFKSTNHSVVVDEDLLVANGNAVFTHDALVSENLKVDGDFTLDGNLNLSENSLINNKKVGFWELTPDPFDQNKNFMSTDNSVIVTGETFEAERIKANADNGIAIEAFNNYENAISVYGRTTVGVGISGSSTTGTAVNACASYPEGYAFFAACGKSYFKNTSIEGILSIKHGHGDWLRFNNTIDAGYWFVHNNPEQDNLSFCYQNDAGENLLGILSMRNNGNVSFANKVGIGDINYEANPDAFLLVKGKTIVEGTIECEKIKVLDVGADFVFEDDYKLMTLKEVEDYIKENNHLPNVPPATETTKGTDLGEFNTILLQKIEELTLYLIEQNKKIEDLAEENKELKESMILLENK